MDCFEAIKRRRSVRAFEAGPIDREDLERIIDAGRLAASGRNTQPWEFVICESAETMSGLAELMQGHFLSSAPAVIAVVVDPAASEFWCEDGSAAIQNMMVAAAALGYGTCWIQGQIRGAESRLKEFLRIPESLKLLALVPVGRTPVWPDMPKKRSLREVTHWNRYRDTDR